MPFSSRNPLKEESLQRRRKPIKSGHVPHSADHSAPALPPAHSGRRTTQAQRQHQRAAHAGTQQFRPRGAAHHQQRHAHRGLLLRHAGRCRPRSRTSRSLERQPTTTSYLTSQSRPHFLLRSLLHGNAPSPATLGTAKRL